MRLFLLMLIVTTIEIILIAKVGNAIGFFNTFIMIIATALLGSWQLKKQWRFVFSKMQSMQSEPSQALIEAMILLVCGVLLITPGFLTDIVGFLGLIPSIREGLVTTLKKRAGGFMRGRAQVFTNDTSGQHSPFSPHQTHQQHSRDHDIIEGEYEKKDD